jgi:Dolichyl-phosphate-mannose-protein mannosyltransferase
MSVEQGADSRNTGGAAPGNASGPPAAWGVTPVDGRPKWFWPSFLAVLAVGAFLRFWRLDNQSLWCDETATIMRICGNFHQIIAMLYGQGLSPSWYVFLWSWVQFLEHVLHIPAGVVFTASVLRTPGALLGVLNVAASYFLARQFVSRRVALLVMLLVAINPFLVYYSRDLKMYGAFYLLVTLNAALYFKWQSSRHWIWWPLYLLSAVAMVGMDFIGWIFLLIQLIWLLVRRRNFLNFLVWFWAFAAAGLFTAWWFTNHSDWITRSIEVHSAVGLEWTSRFMPMDWTSMLDMPATNLLGYQWPVYPPTHFITDWFELGPNYLAHLATRSLLWLAGAEIWAAVGVFAVMLLGLIPWRRILPRQAGGDQKSTVDKNQPAFAQRPNGKTQLTDDTVKKSKFVGALRIIGFIGIFLGALTIVSTCAFMIMSMRDEIAHWQLVIGIVLVIAGINLINRKSPLDKNQPAGRWWHVMLWLAIPIVYFRLASLPPDNPFSLPPHQIIWVPRYWGFITMAWILWLGIAIARMPGIPVRIAALLLVAATMIPSALTDAMIVRDEPWNFINQQILPYYDPTDPDGTLIVYSHVLHGFDDASVSWLTLEHIAPQPLPINNRTINFPWTINPQQQELIPYVRELSSGFNPNNPNQVGQEYGENLTPWLRDINYARSPRSTELHTLVFADRMGDINEGLLSTDVINAELGPQWKLVHESTFNLYFEWRYYFYSPWRIRIWQRVVPPPIPVIHPILPASTAPATGVQ